MNAPHSWPSLSPVSTGLGCKCPRCGEGRLFENLLNVRDRCGHCGLDLTLHDTGDAATVFVIIFLGVIVVGLVMWLELAVQPAIWVHLAAWLSVVGVGSIAMLRPAKSNLVAMHYKNLRNKYETSNDG